MFGVEHGLNVLINLCQVLSLFSLLSDYSILDVLTHDF